LLRPFRSRRPFTRRILRFLHPGKLTPGCKAQRRFAPALSVVAAGSCSFLAWFFTLLSPFGLRQAQSLSAVQGKWHAATAPDIRHRPRWFTPLRRTALKRVKVTTSGRVQQVPAKRQNRGPGNSTGDGF
jgi:hypothetical protein